MDRRLFSWVVASTAFLLIYIALNSMFGPPPRPARQAGDRADAALAEADEGLDPQPDDIAPPVDAEPAEEEVPRPTEPSWRTAGSFDPKSGYYMLITFNSRGGAVERIELTERKENGRLKYRRVDVRSGYLGYLAASTPTDGDGCQVNVVGPGTPAALAAAADPSAPAGLRPGDVIFAANELPIASPADLQRVLNSTEPGARLTLDVLRPAAASAEDDAAEDDAVEVDAADPPEALAVAAADDAGSPQRLRLQATLSEHPLDLVRLASTAGDDAVDGNLNRLSCLMTLAVVGRRPIVVGEREMTELPSQHQAIWDALPAAAADQGGQTVAYRLPVSPSALRAMRAEPVELLRSYTLRPGSYLIDMDLKVINRGQSPQDLAYRLEGANGITLEGWWYSTKISPNWMEGAGARDVVYNTAASDHELVGATTLLAHARDEPEDIDKVLFAPGGTETQQQMKYVGVDAQYFSVAYLPPDGRPYTTDFRRGAAMVVADPSGIPAHQERAVNTSFFLDSKTAEVAPGEALHHRLRMFAGPKQPELLAQYNMSPLIEYGLFPWVAAPLQGILHFFYNLPLVDNYAIAIILLTLLVRGLMFPLSRKAALSAQKMQEIAPELKKIAETYKDDMEKRLKAQRELQQRVGFNPLSGCLPMVIQLPIFIGLYRCLSIDIELRQAALHPSWQWCSNLAGPDMLYYWGDWLWTYLSGRGTGWLGPYFNILPVAVMALFLAQQKMFMPPATDEQTRMTQKVMTIMTVVMGLFFFRVPAGLCIYFITSSIWGMAERKLVKKTIPSSPTPIAAAPATKDGRSAAAPLPNPKLSDRIRSSLGAAEPPRPAGDKRRRPPVKKKR